MKRLLIAVILTLFLGSVFGGGVLAGKNPNVIPVTTTIQGLGPDTVPTYRLQSDLLGSYRSGVNSVVSEIQSVGDWVLETNNSTVRGVLLDLREPVPDSNPNNLPPPFLLAEVPSRLLSRCAVWGGNLKTMTNGSTLLCALSIRFDYGGNSYAVRMNPMDFPETTLSMWTCLGEDGTGKCNQWRLEPGVVQADGQRKNVGRLVRIETVRGKWVYEDRGNYYISFQIDVTNP